MITSHPAIAVVIPSYNRAGYLVDTLRSIYAQTYRPKRVIVVDDGSTDDTLQAVQSFQGNIPALEIIQQKNKGPAAARNRGIYTADDCDWIAFCDSDDIWHHEKLAQQVGVLHNSSLTDIGCVYCVNGNIDDNGTVLPQHGSPHLFGNSTDQIKNGHVPCGSMSSVMIRRDMLVSVNGFDESLQSDEDLELMIRLGPLCVFDFTPNILTFIRIHSGKSSNDIFKLYKSKNHILNKHPGFFAVEGSYIRYLRRDIINSILIRNNWHDLRIFDKIINLPFIFKQYISTIWGHFDHKARAMLLPMMPCALFLFFTNGMIFFGKKAYRLLQKVFANVQR